MEPERERLRRVGKGGGVKLELGLAGTGLNDAARKSIMPSMSSTGAVAGAGLLVAIWKESMGIRSNGGGRRRSLPLGVGGAHLV